jgi:glycosyltransferase involved in cell wall biosynthesis
VRSYYIYRLNGLSDYEIKIAYEACSLFVFPSLYEGFGIPVLEAFKYKVPVVIANNTCLPEVAGLGAKSFNPFEVNDIAQTITLLLNDDVLRQSFIEKVNAQLQNFLNQICSVLCRITFSNTNKYQPSLFS